MDLLPIRCAAAAAAMLLAGCGETRVETLGDALSAYSQNRIVDAEAAFARIAADPSAPPAERARAFRETARIAWLIDGDAARALQALASANRIGADRCATAGMRARVLEESRQGTRLLAEAADLAERCPEPGEGDSVRLRAAQAALDQGELERAEALIAELTPDGRAGLGGAAVQLELALRQRDPTTALAAWRNYFWLGADDLPQALRGSARPAVELFAAGLAPNATTEHGLALLDLLMRGGFFRQAERFAQAGDLASRARGQPVWTRFAAYAEARRELEAIILQANRNLARGRAAADVAAAAERAMERLAAASGLTGERRDVLRRAYGLYGQAGNTGGYPSVHYGHVVQNERRTVEQYGHRADVGFVAVDNMIANGFESWLWDGSAATGGWAEAGQVIVQVRPGYTSAPLSAWGVYRGGPARARLVARQRELAAGDITALARNRVAFLPGLADRLRMQVAAQVGERARRLAGDGGDLRRIFLDEYWRATFQDSILVHEGRHAIDRSLVTGLARFDDSNLEYRAKLSQLALSDFPRLALLNINDPTVGSDSGHGIANARVLRALGEWIEAHRAQVRGYDPALPAMAQIDRLADAQLRAIARSLDPILH
jgi:hypothetical protein